MRCKSVTKRKAILLGGLQDWVGGAPVSKPCINIGTALPAIKFCPASTLNTASRLCAFGGGIIDLGRINIIANAMYHGIYIV